LTEFIAELGQIPKKCGAVSSRDKASVLNPAYNRDGNRISMDKLLLGSLPVIRSYQGRLPHIPASCYVDQSAQVIGDVTLGERSSIWMNAVLRGDVNSIRVGANSNVQDCAVLHGQRNLYKVDVGDWVTIGHNATVHGCLVGDRVLIGMGVTILNDCRIGEGSIIAAGAVLPEHTVVPPGTLWAGVPAKLRRPVTGEDRALILQYAQNYLDYTEIYLKEPVG